jgi:hypothetical protein
MDDTNANKSDMRNMLASFDHKTIEESTGFLNHIYELVRRA